eukprot:6718439-Pyramimonas_sp.AAC.1
MCNEEGERASAPTTEVIRWEHSKRELRVHEKADFSDEGKGEEVRVVEIPPSVVSWYKRQRNYARRRSWCLSEERKRQLSALGFMWARDDELARINWEYMNVED